MGGVDLNDQLRKYYRIGRSSSKWYRYLFWFLIDVSICNSFILFYFWGSNNGQAKRKQVSFRTNLAKQLIAGFSVDSTHNNKRKKIESLSLHPDNAGKHFIEKIKGRKRGCVQCKRREEKTPKRRPIETTFECLQCGVALLQDRLFPGIPPRRLSCFHLSDLHLLFFFSCELKLQNVIIYYCSFDLDVIWNYFGPLFGC
jgi:hypothetical protein